MGSVIRVLTLAASTPGEAWTPRARRLSLEAKTAAGSVDMTLDCGLDAVGWARQCEDLSAGTILPTSMNGDGTRAGYDLEFTRAISDAVSLPVVASGGAGKLEDFYAAVVEGGAEILLAASVFHYRLLGIGQVKEYLRGRGIEVAL